MELIVTGVIKLISSFIGTLGFAIFMHAPKRAWLPASAIGGVAYLVYWALQEFGVNEPMAIFIGALLGSILGQYLARRMKMIATIFVLLSMIPLVPGLGLYRMMAALGQGQIAAGAKTGIQAMITVAMIALGLGAGAFADRVLWSRSRKHRTP